METRSGLSTRTNALGRHDAWIGQYLDIKSDDGRVEVEMSSFQKQNTWEDLRLGKRGAREQTAAVGADGI